MTTLTDIYGPPISTYTRADAIRDGILVDVTATAREAGFTCPVVLTCAAWEDCVAWTERDIALRPRQCQDERGRLWDVLYMGAMAAKSRRRGWYTLYRIKRVPRPGHGHKSLVTLKIHFGSGDDGEPVVTIMQPEED